MIMAFGKYLPSKFFVECLVIFALMTISFNLLGAGIEAAPSAAGITPIPMELLNPRLTEFRRIDANNDDALSFSEYLQSDRPWMETLSRRYHQLDLNSDGRVTRKEFEAFFRGREEAEERQRAQADNFFKQLTVTVGPFVEREQIGNASNGASRTRFFSAGARKFSSAIAQGTGLFPSAAGSSQQIGHHFGPQQQNDENSANFPAAAVDDGANGFLRDHDQHFRLFSPADFPPHHSAIHHGRQQPGFLTAFLPPPNFLGNGQQNPVMAEGKLSSAQDPPASSAASSLRGMNGGGKIVRPFAGEKFAAAGMSADDREEQNAQML